MNSVRVMPTLLLLALLAAAPAAAQDVGLPLGTVPAPVILEDLDGKPVDLRQFVGKRPVLIEFWAEWCDVCNALQPRIEAAARLHARNADVLVIAVGVNQTKRSVRRHLEKHPMPGHLLWDGRGAATRAFEAVSTSYVVVLDAKGRVVYTGVGADQPLSEALGRAVAAR